MSSAVFAGSCPDETTADAGEHATPLQRATEHALWDRYADALSELTQAAAAQPDDVQVYRQRGEVYLRLGRYSQAIADFSSALQLDQPSVQVYLGRANAYRESRRYDEALADYAHAITLRPELAEAFFHRAITYHRLRRFDLERADWNTAIGLDAEIYWLYGTLYRHRHLYNELWSDQHTALIYPPADAKAFYRRAEAFRYRRAYCRALRDYNAALQRRSGYVDAYLGRGVVHYLLGNHRQAIDDLSTVLGRRTTIEAYYYRGQTYAAVGDIARASADLDTARQLAPFDPLIAMTRKDFPDLQP